MAVWDVMRQGDNGDEVRMSGHDSRVDALARVLVMESGVVHKQTYWVSGPPGPALRDEHDLRLYLQRLGHEARSGSWTLSGYLRGLWKVSAPLRHRAELPLDEVAAMFGAAAVTTPPPPDPGWSAAGLALPGHVPAGYPGWERVIKSQVADLEDFAGHPPGEHGRSGTDAPRPAGGGTRATPARWLSLDAADYLERAAAGSRRDPGDDRTPPPQVTIARPAVPPVTGAPVTRATAMRLTWDDLARMAVCGQTGE
ncbi:hypothetical protein ACRYCC_14985 [Actinomadura scrupuli]|uniref:hypothetical protein n=1 Tax=Actinomadura scrupuli TaxID=559629 RepID=UPI003D961D30